MVRRGETPRLHMWDSKNALHMVTETFRGKVHVYIGVNEGDEELPDTARLYVEVDADGKVNVMAENKPSHTDRIIIRNVLQSLNVASTEFMKAMSLSKISKVQLENRADDFHF